MRLTRMAATLTSLGADILALIIDLVDGDDVCILWMCGSRQLNYTLGVGGGVKYFAITDGREMKWPRIVAAFHHLRTFKFLDYRIAGSDVTPDDINTLPSCLEHIELELADDKRPLRNGIFSSPERFPRLHTVFLDGYYNGTVETLRNLPPNVTSFTGRRARRIVAVNVNAGGTNTIVTTTEQDIAALCSTIPASLIKLKINSACFEPNAAFPPSLAVYNTWASSGDWMSLLPRHLESLALENMTHESHLALFPSGLTKLRVYSIKMPMTTFLAALPPTITKLHVARSQQHRVSLDNVRLLPRGLKSINCMQNPISAEMAALLPRCLTDLSTRIIVLQDALHLLPIGVKAIQVSRVNEGGMTFPMPLHCKTLKLHDLSDEMVGKLPPTLATLFAYRGTVTLAHFDALPPTLTALTLSYVKLPSLDLDEYLLRLPRTLRALTIIMHKLKNTGVRFMVSAVSSRAMPRTLTECSLMQLGSVPKEWYRGLPPSITTLSLGVTAFSVADASALPCTRLVNLSLQLDKWNPHILTKLPRTLREIEIYTKAKSIYELSFDDARDIVASLPPRLVECVIPTMGFGEGSLQPYMPKTILTLEFAPDGPVRNGARDGSYGEDDPAESDDDYDF